MRRLSPRSRADVLVSSRSGAGAGLADDFAAQTNLPLGRDRRKFVPRRRRARWACESEDHAPRMESLRASRLDQTRINECASGRGRSREIEDHGAPLASWDAAWERARTPRGHASALAPPHLGPLPSAHCPHPWIAGFLSTRMAGRVRGLHSTRARTPRALASCTASREHDVRSLGECSVTGEVLPGAHHPALPWRGGKTWARRGSLGGDSSVAAAPWLQRQCAWSHVLAE